MGRLFGFIGIDDFVPNEEHQYFANNKFYGMSFVCYLWFYAGNFLADNYFQCLHIGSQYFLSNEILEASNFEIL